MELLVMWITVLLLARKSLSFKQDKVSCCSSKKEDILAFIYPDDYQENEAPIPRNSDEEPLKIKINMNIWAISDISLLRQDIEVDLILTVTWHDKRLSVNPNRTNLKPWFRLGGETFKVWRPTLLFRNCKGCEPVSLGTAVYVEKATGMFWVQERILTKFSCGIYLQAYPMDKQNCTVLMYTNERGKDVLVLEHMKPEEKYFQPTGGLAKSEFYIPYIVKEDDVIEEDGFLYSCIRANIPMERLLGYHLITAFAPTTFIVILSWISFWIPVDVVPARIALGLTSLLTLATRLDQAQRNLPPVSYVKAIDVWMFFCITMVSSSLLEYSVSYYLFRTAAASHIANQKKATVLKVQPFDSKKEDHSPTYQFLDANKLEPQADNTKVDRFSRIAFPASFLIFNIGYWSYYLSYY